MVISLILLAAITAAPLMIAEDAFARYQRHAGGSELNQAASISNSCLNPVSNSNTNDNMISNGNCGGTVSQQGRSGQASTPTTVQNANPTIEVQRSTTAPGLSATDTGNLTIILVCSFCNSNNAGGYIIQVTDGSGQQYVLDYSSTVSGKQSQSVNINTGLFQVEEFEVPTPGSSAPSFSGACSGEGEAPQVATGNIDAGQSVTCTITQNNL